MWIINEMIKSVRFSDPVDRNMARKHNGRSGRGQNKTREQAPHRDRSRSKDRNYPKSSNSKSTTRGRSTTRSNTPSQPRSPSRNQPPRKSKISNFYVNRGGGPKIQKIQNLVQIKARKPTVKLPLKSILKNPISGTSARSRTPGPIRESKRKIRLTMDPSKGSINPPTRLYSRETRDHMTIEVGMGTKTVYPDFNLVGKQLKEKDCDRMLEEIGIQKSCRRYEKDFSNNYVDKIEFLSAYDMLWCMFANHKESGQMDPSYYWGNSPWLTAIFPMGPDGIYIGNFPSITDIFKWYIRACDEGERIINSAVTLSGGEQISRRAYADMRLSDNDWNRPTAESLENWKKLHNKNYGPNLAPSKDGPIHNRLKVIAEMDINFTMDFQSVVQARKANTATKKEPVNNEQLSTMIASAVEDAVKKAMAPVTTALGATENRIKDLENAQTVNDQYKEGLEAWRLKCEAKIVETDDNIRRLENRSDSILHLTSRAIVQGLSGNLTDPAVVAVQNIAQNSDRRINDDLSKIANDNYAVKFTDPTGQTLWQGGLYRSIFNPVAPIGQIQSLQSDRPIPPPPDRFRATSFTENQTPNKKRDSSHLQLSAGRHAEAKTSRRSSARNKLNLDISQNTPATEEELALTTQEAAVFINNDPEGNWLWDGEKALALADERRATLCSILPNGTDQDEWLWWTVQLVHKLVPALTSTVHIEAKNQSEELMNFSKYIRTPAIMLKITEMIPTNPAVIMLICPLCQDHAFLEMARNLGKSHDIELSYSAPIISSGKSKHAENFLKTLEVLLKKYEISLTNFSQNFTNFDSFNISQSNSILISPTRPSTLNPPKTVQTLEINEKTTESCPPSPTVSNFSSASPPEKIRMAETQISPPSPKIPVSTLSEIFQSEINDMCSDISFRTAQESLTPESVFSKEIESLISDQTFHSCHSDQQIINKGFSTIIEARDYFAVKGISEVRLLGKRVKVDSIEDLKIFELLRKIFNSGIRSTILPFETIREQVKPISDSLELQNPGFENRYGPKTERLRNPFSDQCDVIIPPEVRFKVIKDIVGDVTDMGKITQSDIVSQSRVNDLKIINMNIPFLNGENLSDLVKIAHDTAIFCLNEISLDVDNANQIVPKGYKIYCGEKCARGLCYSAILVRNELVEFISVAHKKYSILELQVHDIKNELKFSITSLYHPNPNSIKWELMGLEKGVQGSTAFFDEINKITTKNQNQLALVVGDFNVELLNRRLNENSLFELINNSMEGFVNLCYDSTFIREGMDFGSSIDGCFSNKDVTFEHLNLRDLGIGDGHLGQKIYLDHDMRKYNKLSKRYVRKSCSKSFLMNFSKVMYPEFEAIGKSELEPEKKLERYQSLLNKMVDVCEPEKLVEIEESPPKPVFSDETLAIREKLFALRELRRREPSNTVIRKAHSNMKARLLESQKFDRQNELLISRQSERLNLEEYWKISSKIMTGAVSSQKCPHSADSMGEFFQELQRKTNNPPPPNIDEIWSKRKLKVPAHALFKFEKVTWTGDSKSDSVEKAFLSLKKSTRDKRGLTRRFLESFSEEYKQVLVDMVNFSLITGEYLAEWQTNKLVPIPKRPPFNQKKNWRPITIGSTIAMLVEKIAVSQLADYLERLKMLSDCQHGFRKYRNCATAITSILNAIQKGHKKFCVLTAIDGANAFGSVGHNKILTNLASFCVFTTLRWFFNFFSNRAFFVEVNGERSKIFQLPKSSVNQGSGPGPVVFNLSFDPVIQEMSEEFDIKVCCFADDFCYLVMGDTIEECTEKVEQIGKVLIERMAKIADIKCNPTKTECIKFGKDSENRIFRVGGAEIAESLIIRYLGYKLNNKLTQESHLNYLAGRMVSTSFKIEKMCSYGRPLQVAHHFISMTDGLFNHGTGGLKITYKSISRLEKIRNKGLKSLLGLPTYDQENHRINQIDLLRRAGIKRSLWNVYRYNVINFLSTVWNTGEPRDLYYDLKECLQPTGTYLFELAKHGGKGQTWGSDEWSEYYFDVRRGEYDLKIKPPPRLTTKEAKSRKWQNSWPLNIAKIFNDLPKRLRGRLGQRTFKGLIKNYFDSICQHASANKSCKYCDPPAYTEKAPLESLKIIPDNLSNIAKSTIEIILYDPHYSVLKKMDKSHQEAVEGLFYEIFHDIV